MNKKLAQIHKPKTNITIIFAITFLCTVLTGCAPTTTKNIIPPIKYRDNIGIHIPKTAYIQWIPGKMVRHEKETYSYTSNNSGGVLGTIVAGLVVATIDNQQRKNNPSQYVNEYGKADEVVFMTSLKDSLAEQNVFKKIELVTNLDNVKSNDILIQIYFKSARLTTLTVKLSIKTGKKPIYERTYLVQNNNEEIHQNFLAAKTAVSQKLLSEIISGIKNWHGENK